MKIPETWTPDLWARAASPTLPEIREVKGHLVSDGTSHHADYVGDGRWVVDWLPGRQFEAKAAKTAMYIASAPGWPEVERWAPVLGLTPAEARAFVAGEAVR